MEDEWGLVTTRLDGDPDAYLEPHNEHLLLVPVVIFKALLATVGLDDYWLYRLALALVHLTCVALLFTIVQRRRGPAVAAIASAPILVLGSSSEVLLFPIDVGFAASMAAGLGALLALDGRSRGGDVAACALLVVSLASSGLGVSIALGVLVEVVWDRDRWRRLWVVALPGALYGAWYLAYNLDPNRQGPLEYAEAPEFALRVAGAAVAGLLGIPEYETGGTWARWWATRVGVGLVLAAAAALVWLVIARRALSGRLAMLVVTLGSYWAALGVSRAYTDAPGAPRYIYAGAILVVLIAVEATRRMRIPRAALAGLAVVALVATAWNARWLEWNGDRYREKAGLTEAELGALELMRGDVDPGFKPILRPAYPMVAGGYFAAVDRLDGSVAATGPELVRMSPAERTAADAVLVRGALRRVPDTRATRRFLRASGAAVPPPPACHAARSVTLAVPPRWVAIRPQGGSVTVGVGRFGPGVTEIAPVAEPTLLLARRGSSSVPWRLRLAAAQPFRVC
jgi:hypothetical protein